MSTHSLAEVAAEHLPAEWKNPTRWLAERLNRGELRGVRFGRVWRMRDSDIDYLLSRYSNDAKVAEPDPRATESGATPVLASLSKRSRWRSVDAS